MKRSYIASLVLVAAIAPATAAEVVVRSTDFGTIAEPYTASIGETLAPFGGSFDPSDYFVADYGFTTTADSVFSGAVVTFDLAPVLQLQAVSIVLLQGAPFAGSTPTLLTDAQVGDIASRTLAASGGNGVTQTLPAFALAAGRYVLEVRGQVGGSAGGSYAGVLNLASVAAVPEPAGGVLAALGLGWAGWLRRRRSHTA